jgi:hypothetical protein
MELKYQEAGFHSFTALPDTGVDMEKLLVQIKGPIEIHDKEWKVCLSRAGRGIASSGGGSRIL